MELSIEQIERLYRFTREHYVEWYDLQTELVDHLAFSIEEQWAKNPKLPFEEALQVEFKKFGVFGFMDVVEKRQTALCKKYNKLVWHHFKGFFKVPQIILTVGMVVGLFGLVKLIYFNYLFTILFAFTFILFLIHMFKARKKINKNKEKTGKLWLFESMLMGHGSVVSLFMIPFHFGNIFIRGENVVWIENNLLLAVVCFLVVSFYLSVYIVTVIIPAKAEEYLMETYPEYKMLKTE